MDLTGVGELDVYVLEEPILLVLLLDRQWLIFRVMHVGFVPKRQNLLTLHIPQEGHKAKNFL